MKYRKKPIEIEALQWQGNNYEEIVLLSGYPYQLMCDVGFKELHIKTLEGWMIARISDYVVRGIRGELYPVKEDIFLETYTPCEEEERND